MQIACPRSPCQDLCAQILYSATEATMRISCARSLCPDLWDRTTCAKCACQASRSLHQNNTISAEGCASNQKAQLYQHSTHTHACHEIMTPSHTKQESSPLTSKHIVFHGAESLRLPCKTQSFARHAPANVVAKVHKTLRLPRFSQSLRFLAPATQT